MIARCIWCGVFLRYVEPFDEMGVIHQACRKCLDSITVEDTDSPRIRQGIWAVWQDEGGEG